VTDEPTDVVALFERLKAEVRAAGPRGGEANPAQVRLSIRDQAERLWSVSAERPMYVEPAMADQRAFNDAVLKLIDDLDERVARLERR
jgi:hypothetical protein